MFQRDFKEFIELLNNHAVEYLLVGGYALAIHGHPRYTGDMEIWVNHAEQSALTQASNFCSNISIGQQADAILEQAWAVGADKRHTRWVTGEAGKANWLPVTFIGAGVFSRHFCSIDAQDGIVITKQVTFMD